MQVIPIVTAVALVGASGMVAAQTSRGSDSVGAYAGIGAGQSDYDLSDSDWGAGLSTEDDSDTAWRIFGGARLHPYFGAEAGYYYLGEANARPGGKAEVQGVDVVGMGFLPLYQQGSHSADAFVKAGGYWWDADVDAGAGTDLRSTDDFDYTYGAGAQYHFDNIGVRLEWQRYNDVFGSTDTDVWMASAMFGF